jgi:hypothetical protein
MAFSDVDTLASLEAELEALFDELAASAAEEETLPEVAQLRDMVQRQATLTLAVVRLLRARFAPLA